MPPERNCPTGGQGDVQQTATYRGDSIRRYPSIRRAERCRLGRGDTPAHEVAKSRPTQDCLSVVRVIERVLCALRTVHFAGYWAVANLALRRHQSLLTMASRVLMSRMGGR